MGGKSFTHNLLLFKGSYLQLMLWEREAVYLYL